MERLPSFAATNSCKVISTERVIEVFNDLFRERYQTVLMHANSDPVYLPRGEGRRYNELKFAYGFVSSALHEISHWCIAGAARRELEDFGYWYKPTGRSEQEQKDFESHEVGPQALEWIFSSACGVSFHPSLDNHEDRSPDFARFESKLLGRISYILRMGLPFRASMFAHALILGFSSYTRFEDYWRANGVRGCIFVGRTDSICDGDRIGKTHSASLT